MSTYSYWARFAYGFALGSLAFFGFIAGWALNPSYPAAERLPIVTIALALAYLSVFWIPIGGVVGLFRALITLNIRRTAP